MHILGITFIIYVLKFSAGNKSACLIMPLSWKTLPHTISLAATNKGDFSQLFKSPSNDLPKEPDDKHKVGFQSNGE